MVRCPRCQGHNIFRTPTESNWTLLRRRLTTKRPHRCAACGWRGWGEETPPQFTEQHIALAARAIREPVDVRAQVQEIARVLDGKPAEAPEPQPKHKGILFDENEKLPTRFYDSPLDLSKSE